VNAASRLTEVLTQHKIDRIINIGVSGATKPYKLNTLYQVEKAYYHDAHAEAFGYKPYQIPGMPTHYETTLSLSKDLNFDKAILYSGDEFVTEHKGFEGLIDMEGTALYQVAYMFKKPIIAFKLVSDVIGETSYHEFSLKEASHTLETLLKQLEVL
jgi:adenosylhomocysteine nucleosidase